MKAVHPPFELGTTLPGTDSQANLINDDILGQIWQFPTFNATSRQRGQKNRPGGGRMITAVALRNNSGLTLLGKRFALIELTAGYLGVKNINGYAVVNPKRNIVLIDSWLSSSGVADKDIFWGIIAGPAIVLTPMAGADQVGDIAVGSPLVNSTGTTSGVTTSGRVALASIANATDATGAFNQSLAMLGRALSARTTGETNSDLLVDLNIQSFGRGN